MVSPIGTMAEDAGLISDEGPPGAAHDVLLWGVAVFALGVLSAWIGTFAWIVATFLAT